MPGFATEHLLSAWKFDSGEVFLSSLRDAELATDKYISEEGLLADPPLQVGSSQPGIYEELDEDDYAVQSSAHLCKRNAPGSQSNTQERPSPAKNGPSMDVNAVEVVKRDGKYYLVMDGVSYGTLLPGENRFWMPRFKESVMQDNGPSTARRVVQPVLFSMRLEAFEGVPASCVVEARQRVVNDGTVYMDDDVIKTNKINPYQTGSMSAGVTILPYPLICAPPPYVTINDYSKVLDRELALKLHYLDPATKQKIDEAFTNLLGASAATAAASTAAAVAAVASSITSAVSTLSGAAYSLFKLGVSVATNAGSTTAAATGAATLMTGGVPVVSTAVATGAAYLLWEYLRKRKVTSKFDDNELSSVKAALSSALNRGPTVYRVTIDKLTSIIYRIAETRANGSVMSKSDNTVGMSIHDFANQGWNEEAAFMQWLMYGNGTREGRDPVTGLFSETSNSKHAKLYGSQKEAVEAAATMNTIGLQGLDGLTLSNCRTEFSYAIKIKESDGSDGPTILLSATRINGLDAGWLASGFNEQFRECRRAANCLRSRLARLPGVSRYMASHGTFVSDTNNGAILSDDLTDMQRLLLGRELEDASGVRLTRDELKKRLERVQKRRSKAENRQTRHSNYVERQRQRVKKLQENLAKLKNQRAPNAERIRAAETRLKEQKRSVTAAERQQELYTDETAYMQNREQRAQSLANGSDKSRRFVNIFNYEEVHHRIVHELLGGPLFGYTDDEQSAGDLFRDTQDDFDTQFEIDAEYDVDTDEDESGPATEKKTTRTFWNGVASSESENNLTGVVKMHVDTSRVALADSLGIQEYEITSTDDDFMRFMRFLCPQSLEPNEEAMRFAAFIVPRKRERLLSGQSVGSTIVRIIPQVLSFESGLVSTFGKVTIMQPTAVSDKTFILQNEASLASKTIAQSRVALRSMTAVFPRLIKDMRIYDTTGHLCQIYKLKTDQGVVSKTFNRRISSNSIAADFLAMSFFPDASVLEAILQADKAGGNFIASMTRIASGQKLAGVAKLVSEAGLPVEVSSFIAAASFSEIVAYHLVEHGVVVDEKVGFELQRIELVRGAVFNARYSAQVIGQFLSDNYSGNKNKTKDLSYDDVCFYCIPGLSHLRVALRRLGIFSDFSSTASMELCHRVGKALYRLGSSQRSVLEGFPFVCLQSAVAYIPKSVRFVEGYSSAIDIHVKLCALSYERVLLGSVVCASDWRARACVCTDVVYSRPSVLKQFSVRPLDAARVVSESNNAKAQSKWSLPAPSIGMNALRYRAAKLRLDIHDEYKNERAATELHVLNEEFNRIAQMDLVQKMTALDVRDFASIDITNPVANYMVPFGMTDIGTPRDIIHSKFEQQPVWVQELEAAAAAVIVSDSATPDVVARSAIYDEHGRPNHPLVIKIKVKSAEMVLVPNKKVGGARLDVVPITMPSESVSLPSLCKYIDEENKITGVSGQLTEYYRRCMHNAERIFQLVVLVSSGVAASGAPENLKIALELEDADSYHMPVLVSCVCIANALAKTIAGSSCAVVTKDTVRGEADACAKIMRMCQVMTLAGVKAVPFCEMCAVTSLLASPLAPTPVPNKTFLPALQNLSLIEQCDIAAPKRKTPSKSGGGSQEDGELSEEERRALETRALDFALSAAELLAGSTLSEAETHAQMMLATTPDIFRIPEDKVEERRQLIELVLSKRFWKGRFQWGSPGDACPINSSAVRLLQSMKSNAFAAAHAPLEDDLPANAPPETASLRETLKRLIASMGGGAGSSTDTLTSADQSAFELDLSRIILFSDVQTAPYPERMRFIEFMDDEINGRLTVGPDVVEIVRAHMRMLFFATILDMETNSDPANQPFIDLMKKQWSVRISGVANDIFSHIQADLSFQREENDNVSLLVRTYWEELRKIIYSEVIDGDESQMEVDEEGDKCRETPPDDAELSREFERAYTEWDQLAAKSPADNARLKSDFIRMFMRIACYKDKFGWFAQSGMNLYSLAACASRSALWRGRNASEAAARAKDGVAAALDGKTAEEVAEIQKEAAQETQKGGIPPENVQDIVQAIQEDMAADAPLPQEGMQTLPEPEPPLAGAAPVPMENAIVAVMMETGDMPAMNGTSVADSTRNASALATSTTEGEQTTAPTIHNASPSQEAAAEEARVALRVNAEMQELLNQTQARVDAATAKAKESEEKEAKSRAALEAKEKEVEDAKKQADSFQQEIERLDKEKAELQATNKSMKTKAAKIIKEKTAEEQQAREQADQKRKDAEAKLTEKINEFYRTRQAAVDTESELKRQLSIMRAEKAELEAANETTEDEELQFVLNLLRKMTPGLEELSRAAMNGPPSEAAAEYAERANKDLDAAQDKINQVEALVRDFLVRRGDFKELLRDITELVGQVGEAFKERKDSLLEKAWKAMKSHAALIWAMLKDPQMRQRMLGWAYGVVSAAKQLFFVLAGIGSVLRRRSQTGGSTQILPDEQFGALSGIFTLGSVVLTAMQGQAIDKNDPWYNYFFLYRAAVQMYDVFNGNKADPPTWLPMSIFTPFYRLLGGTGVPIMKPTPGINWNFAVTVLVNIAATSGALFGGKHFSLFLNGIGGIGILGPRSGNLTPRLMQGLYVVNAVYAAEELYMTVVNLPGITRIIWNGVTYVLDGTANAAMALIRALGIRAYIPLDKLAAIGIWIAANPLSFLTLIALALALGYSYKRGYLDKYAPTDEQYETLAKRVRMVAKTAKDKVVAGGGRVKEITYQKFTDAFLKAAAASQEGEVAGAEEGDSEAAASDESADPMEDLTGEGGNDDDEDDGAGTGTGIFRASIAEMAKLQGVKINDPTCGSFVILNKPSKQHPSVSACLALMLNTDMHGMGR